ncbi:MAG: Rho termination factor N-terminal domain-containing protein [Solirubrobacterales bacterium]|nr:Rho termination factor N-terminal domain-containing protein [Solirubrobacterales bacterium]MCB8915920.1 Rho termination factor N-terminal domain-containing protein [Thermoleophilales bacterium]
MSDLKSKSLAELHELAGKAGIEKFRLLRRDELIEKLGDGDREADKPESAASDRSEGGSRRRRGDRDRGRRGDRERRGNRDRDRQSEKKDEGSGDTAAEAETDRGAEPELSEITGVLDVLPRGSGIIRAEDGPSAGIYVSPAQIRRCELRSGDEVSGPVRPARRGERRPSLVRVEKVNGEPPVDERSPRFESLTPVAPHRHMPLSGEADDILARSVDLLAPLAFGQRVLVEAQPRSGRTSFLRSLAKAIARGAGDDAEIIVLLIDERPEEVTAWSREVPEVEIAAAPADLGAHEQVRTAERILAKVKRQAEAGGDVVIIVDSLTRLGNAYGDPGAVKPFFGAGRELEEEGAGSITVIATALWGSPGDQDVMDAVHTTENSTIRLDAGLAASGVEPSLDVTACAVSGQESVLDKDQVDAVRRLRAELKDMEPVPAANRLAELIKGSRSNEELLKKL